MRVTSSKVAASSVCARNGIALVSDAVRSGSFKSPRQPGCRMDMPGVRISASNRPCGSPEHRNVRPTGIFQQRQAVASGASQRHVARGPWSFRRYRNAGRTTASGWQRRRQRQGPYRRRFAPAYACATRSYRVLGSSKYEWQYARAACSEEYFALNPAACLSFVSETIRGFLARCRLPDADRRLERGAEAGRPLCKSRNVLIPVMPLLATL